MDIHVALSRLILDETFAVLRFALQALPGPLGLSIGCAALLFAAWQWRAGDLELVIAE